MGRVLIPGEVGSAIEPRLTVDGLRDMLQDMRAAGKRMPTAILVSERDRRDINQDLLAGSVSEVSKEDQRPEHDGQCLGYVEGVMIGSSVDVPRGKARLIFGAYSMPTSDKLGGEGLVIVGV